MLIRFSYSYGFSVRPRLNSSLALFYMQNIKNIELCKGKQRYYSVTFKQLLFICADFL